LLVLSFATIPIFLAHAASLPSLLENSPVIIFGSSSLIPQLSPGNATTAPSIYDEAISPVSVTTQTTQTYNVSDDQIKPTTLQPFKPGNSGQVSVAEEMITVYDISPAKGVVVIQGGNSVCEDIDMLRVGWYHNSYIAPRIKCS